MNTADLPRGPPGRKATMYILCVCGGRCEEVTGRPPPREQHLACRAEPGVHGKVMDSSCKRQVSSSEAAETTWSQTWVQLLLWPLISGAANKALKLSGPLFLHLRAGTVATTLRDGFKH